MTFARRARTTDSDQLIGARPSRPAFQVWQAGAPPLPVQTTIGLPSAAALRLASQRLVSQGISRQRDSPGCGLISLWTFSNCSGVIGAGGFAGFCWAPRWLSSCPNQTRQTIAPRVLLRLVEYMACLTSFDSFAARKIGHG